LKLVESKIFLRQKEKHKFLKICLFLISWNVYLALSFSVTQFVLSWWSKISETSYRCCLMLRIVNHINFLCYLFYLTLQKWTCSYFFFLLFELIIIIWVTSINFFISWVTSINFFVYNKIPIEILKRMFWVLFTHDKT
jgi:hypothetical protein